MTDKWKEGRGNAVRKVGTTTNDYATLLDILMVEVDSLGLVLLNTGTDSLNYQIIGYKHPSGVVPISLWSGTLLADENVQKDLGARWGRLVVQVKSTALDTPTDCTLEAVSYNFS